MREQGGFSTSVQDVLKPLTTTPPAFSAAGQQIQLFASQRASTILAVNPVGGGQNRGGEEAKPALSKQQQQAQGALVANMQLSKDEAGAERRSVPLESGAASSGPLPSRLRPQDRPTQSLSEVEAPEDPSPNASQRAPVILAAKPVGGRQDRGADGAPSQQQQTQSAPVAGEE